MVRKARQGKVETPVLSILSTPISHNRTGGAPFCKLKGAKNTAVEQPRNH